MSCSRICITLAPLLVLGLLPACEDPQTSSATRTVSDPAMTAAISEGRATFSEFLRAFRSPEEGWGSFQVRHGYTNEAGFDANIWLDLQSVGADGLLHCIVPEDEDERTIQFEPGQELTTEPSSINDWLFIDHRGTFVGGYTLRVTMDRIGDTSNDTEDNMHGGILFRNLEDLREPEPDSPEAP